MVQNILGLTWRRIVAFSASLALALTLIPATALIAPASAEPDDSTEANAESESGYMQWEIKAGPSTTMVKYVKWVIDDDGVLSLSSDVIHDDYDTSINPWVAKGHKDKIKEVKIDGNVDAPFFS